MASKYEELNTAIITGWERRHELERELGAVIVSVISDMAATPGGTHQILSTLLAPTRISSRNAVFNAAALRLRAILFFAGFRFRKLNAVLRSTPKFSAA